MVKQGPCYHCGVTSTPLWRNGPPEKPVLCNACGSRWRTKGTLANYTPLHSRADFENYEDHKVARTKGVSMNKKKEVKVPKRKYDSENMTVGGNSHEYSQSFHKFADDDTSNWSSSGSALSNSESCAQFGSADASDLSGPAQSVVWDSLVPSRKRTCVNRPKPSAVEKLTRDLYTILHEQQSSCLSGSSEEDLLLESETPMVSVEIGHGSVLIKHPSSIAREEESEASSLSVENKQLKINNVHSHPLTIPVHNNKFVNLPSSKAQTLESPFGQGKEQGQLKRAQHEKLRMLGAQSSPPLSIELRDLLNFDQFVKHLNYEEQQQLLKYLPQVDRANFPDSLRSMFDGAAFLENLSSFQHLLAEGFFDNLVSVAKDEDYRTLRRLVPSNSIKCKWAKISQKVKKLKNGSGNPGSEGSREIVSSSLIKGKVLHDIQKQKHTEINAKMTSPGRLIMGGSSKNKEIAESDGSCFSPRSLLAVPPDGGALLLDSFHVAGDNSEQDLLLDVPSNSSFPQAELLRPAMSFISPRQALAVAHCTHSLFIPDNVASSKH